MKKLAAPAVKALKNKEITFYPEAKREQVITYLESVKDWNISRQIAWGIPIPAFQNVEDSDDWIFNTQVDEHEITVDGKTYRRDPDVFDTWFSSSQWPFVTLDYPDSEDFKKFYPNTVMETGQDILYQWVSRMICLGLYVTGEIPFKNVYLHGMVRSEDGRKMSKSLGNVIDPKEVLEAYGADAIRMGILSGRSAGYSAAYAPGKIIAGRNFCNKLWNIARYAQNGYTGSENTSTATPETIADHWILSRLSVAQAEISKLIEDYRFSEAYEVLYHFIWNEVADWYIEASKGSDSAELLHYVVGKGLQLAHPFAPFVTEAIWQQINPGTFLISKQWEPVLEFDKKQAESFTDIQSIVLEIRAINSSLGIKNVPLEYMDSHLIDDNSNLLKKLAKLGSVSESSGHKGVKLATTSENCWLIIDETITRSYLDKLQERISTSKNSIKQLQGRLENKSYTLNAPKQIVEQTREALRKETEILETLTAELKNFSR
jgi:valyl-tRNA synthetase